VQVCGALASVWCFIYIYVQFFLLNALVEDRLVYVGQMVLLFTYVVARFVKFYAGWK
jgi:hypothetical protein